MDIPFFHYFLLSVIGPITTIFSRHVGLLLSCITMGSMRGPDEGLPRAPRPLGITALMRLWLVRDSEGVVSSLTQVRSTWRKRKVSFVHFNYCIGLRVEAIAEFLFVLSLLRMNVDTPICAELYNAWECIFLINMNYLF